MSLRFSLPSVVHSHALPAFSIALAVSTILAASPAFAQTAHVSYTQSTVASGVGNAAGVAVDGSGNVYVVDNGTVLKETLSAGGSYTQSTVASSTVDVFQGVAVDGSGNVYITYLQGSNGGGVLEETPSDSSYTESTIVSGLVSPRGVAVDGSGNVYVADSGASLVLKETATGSGYTQSTVAGGLNAPAGVAVDWSGNVYITVTNAANGGGVVLKETLSGSTYTQSTIGNAPSGLYGLAVDDNGNVYVANSTANLVLKETPSGNGYTQSTAISGLNGPVGVAVATGANVYIANSGGSNVLKESVLADFGPVPVGSSSSTVLVSFTFDTTGTPRGWNVYTQGAKGLDFTEVAAGTTCSTSTNYAAGDTCSVAIRFSPRYAGLRMGAVQLLDAGGDTIATALLRGIGSAPQVVFPGNPTVRTVGSGIATSYAVAVDASGDVFVVNGSTVEEIVATNGQVSSGSTVNTVGTGFNGPRGVAVDARGDVFVADGPAR